MTILTVSKSTLHKGVKKVIKEWGKGSRMITSKNLLEKEVRRKYVDK